MHGTRRVNISPENLSKTTCNWGASNLITSKTTQETRLELHDHRPTSFGS